jgi:hypothetical protein
VEDVATTSIFKGKKKKKNKNHDTLEEA